jgi:GAF domain-containing protein
VTADPFSTADLPLTDELAGVSARISGLLLSRETVTSALGLITSLAVDTVPGSVGAGVTIVDEQGRRTSGATDKRVERADDLQYRLDEGPCLAATAARQVTRVDDIASDPRWPRWGARVARMGLRSALSAPMVAGDAGLGAVKVYGDRAAAFDRTAEHRLSLFAAQAAILVANVTTYERAKRMSEGLRDAVRGRDVVNTAKGYLMARHGVDEDTALGLLLARSHQDSSTLREAATAVLGSAVRRRR